LGFKSLIISVVGFRNFSGCLVWAIDEANTTCDWDDGGTIDNKNK
jgi:hypothetical protein